MFRITLEDKVIKLKERLDNIVSCEKCLCLLNKQDAPFVDSFNYSNVYHQDGKVYYCKTHKPLYDKVEYFSGMDMKTKYHRNNVPVNEKGEVIK